MYCVSTQRAVPWAWLQSESATHSPQLATEPTGVVVQVRVVTSHVLPPQTEASVAGVQAPQRPETGSQVGVEPPQSAELSQPSQRFVEGLQRGSLAVQSELSAHSTHVPAEQTPSVQSPSSTHSPQLPAEVSHRGVAPPQSSSPSQPTQSPKRHTGASFPHSLESTHPPHTPSTHGSPEVQSVSSRHSAQRERSRQNGSPAAVHSESPTHSTHVPNS